MAKRPVAKVGIWNQEVGAVAWDPDRDLGTFQYSAEFAKTDLQLSPVRMPVDPKRIFSFPALNRDTFFGLPGLLADALPDKFGNALIDLWLRKNGRSLSEFSPVERLCYMGTRGMGALEFEPAIGPVGTSAKPLSPSDLADLADLAQSILTEREGISVNLNRAQEEALNTIIRVGTSAGGARAKAVIAWNRSTGEVRSGQVPLPDGFEPWLLKFDGAASNALGDPQGYGRIEYGYHLMAVAAGIEMSECRLLEEGGRAHFMTRRFDRASDGSKVHMQSLCALGHYDFNMPGHYSYEHVFEMILKLHLPHAAMGQQFRRMVFNILARNQDDHTRNVAFLMDKDGSWRLTPAFDVVYAHNPSGAWTNKHQMSANGKRDGFTVDDLTTLAGRYGIADASSALEGVSLAIRNWPEYAARAGVSGEDSERIGLAHRTDLLKATT